ncbi:reticulon-4-interacting protein 1, mitochondrial [Lepeophtheirus salmonis]|uniref:reticulon-4-interacting protein 1, mitochondrial n=1 Tax=Lepeophtheirus salmonis TaxID=72036 RepID=UPI001AE884DD|nr:reticulon-4-interacting protein 1, mitochondrial-like [Lepeophtheirus salmonis]
MSMMSTKKVYNMVLRCKSTISAWRLHEYNGPTPSLKLDKIPFPRMNSPNEVIVKVHATSINPLDVMMVKGYGKKVIGTLRSLGENHNNAPFTLGRDFSGTVFARGGNLLNKYKVGDEVWGATFPSLEGCHAEYITVHKDMMAKKPKGCSHVEAASIPYAALTAWSALSLTALTQKGWNTLVIGAAGGVGSLAAQILKSWDCDVTAVCSTDALPLVTGLGVDRIIDYKDNDFMDKLSKLKKFDVILDCTDSQDNYKSYMNLLNKSPHSNYVTLSSPVLSSTDSQGFVSGIASSVGQLICKNTTPGSYRWGYFAPNQKALKSLSDLVENGKLVALVNETYGFSDLIIGHGKLHEGHARGKIVIDLEK